MEENHKNSDSKTEEPVTEFVRAVRNISATAAQKKVNLALKDRDVQFQTAIEETKQYAEKIAREEIQKEVRSVKNDIFVMFGIFASFIAFIVGEINILKTIDSIYDKLGFSFVFVSLMLGFLFGMMFLMEKDEDQKKFLKMKKVFWMFFTIGITFILLGKIHVILHIVEIL